MKIFSVVLFAAGLLSAETLYQPMPKVSANSLLIRRVTLLSNVCFCKFGTAGGVTGVLAEYSADYGHPIYNKKEHWSQGSRGYSHHYNSLAFRFFTDEPKRSNETIFITGLNHSLITDDCYIAHLAKIPQRKVSSDSSSSFRYDSVYCGFEECPGLYVWFVGVKEVTTTDYRGARTVVRVKHYTVDPNELSVRRPRPSLVVDSPEPGLMSAPARKQSIRRRLGR